MPEKYANNYETTLNGSIDASQTTLVVTTATGAPTTGVFRLFIKAEGANTDEIVTVSSVSGTTFTIARASEAVAGVQSASAHGNAASVALVLTAGSLGNNVQGQTGGSTSIIIPGLSASSDIRVAGTNDDEFDTTDTSDPMTGWTTLGTPASHDINSTALSHYYVKKATASAVNWVGIYKANPSMPFTVTTKIAALNGRVAFNSAMLMVGEATPGKMLAIGLRYQALANERVELDSWTTPTGTGTTLQTGPNIWPAPPTYVRFVVTSSTNISTYVSADGLLWSGMDLARNPSFTVGSVGLMVEAEGGTTDVEGLFDWIRFT